MTVTASKIKDLVRPEPVYSCADHIEINFNKSDISINFVDLPEDFDCEDADYVLESLGDLIFKKSNGELKPKECKFLSEHTLSLIFDIAC